MNSVPGTVLKGSSGLILIPFCPSFGGALLLIKYSRLAYLLNIEHMRRLVQIWHEPPFHIWFTECGVILQEISLYQFESDSDQEVVDEFSANLSGESLKNDPDD